MRHATRRLNLRSETIRVLGAASLRSVHGGEAAESGGVPCISYFTDCTSDSDVLSHRCTTTWPPP